MALAARTRLSALEGSAMDDRSDLELIARAKTDRQAFGLLYDRYAVAVYRYCYNRLGNREAAEDAMAEVFAKALVALPDCRDASFRPWLFRIAHNVVVDAFRSARQTEPLLAATSMADPSLSPEERALATDRERELQRALDRLTADQRGVVELRRSGLTGPEIAVVMGWGLSRVKVTQFRAYSRLRQLLSADMPEEVVNGGHR